MKPEKYCEKYDLKNLSRSKKVEFFSDLIRDFNKMCDRFRKNSHNGELSSGASLTIKTQFQDKIQAIFDRAGVSDNEFKISLNNDFISYVKSALK